MDTFGGPKKWTLSEVQKQSQKWTPLTLLGESEKSQVQIQAGIHKNTIAQPEKEKSGQLEKFSKGHFFDFPCARCGVVVPAGTQRDANIRTPGRRSRQPRRTPSGRDGLPRAATREISFFLRLREILSLGGGGRCALWRVPLAGFSAPPRDTALRKFWRAGKFQLSTFFLLG